MAATTPNANTIQWRQGLGEGVVVLVGILLALAADAGWDHWQDRAREREYLESLRDDLRDSQRRLSASLGARQYQRDAALQLLRSSQKLDEVERDSLHSLLSTVVDRVTFSPSMASYDDLVNSGGLSLLRSPELRIALSRVARRLDELAELQRRVTDFEENDLRPFLRDRVLTLDLIPADRYPLDDLPGVPTNDYAGLVASRAFANLAAARLESSQDMVQMSQALLAEIGRALTHVDAQLDG